MDYYFDEAWWCPLPETEYTDQGNEVQKVVPKPAFLTARQLETSRREHFALAALGDAKAYLGKEVIEWAKASPADARIPEALFIAVQANTPSKYGCIAWDNAEKIKDEAEKMLRQRYPESPWTAKLSAREPRKQYSGLILLRRWCLFAT